MLCSSREHLSIPSSAISNTAAHLLCACSLIFSSGGNTCSGLEQFLLNHVRTHIIYTETHPSLWVCVREGWSKKTPLALGTEGVVRFCMLLSSCCSMGLTPGKRGQKTPTPGQLLPSHSSAMANARPCTTVQAPLQMIKLAKVIQSQVSKAYSAL